MRTQGGLVALRAVPVYEPFIVAGQSMYNLKNTCDGQSTYISKNTCESVLEE